MPEPDQQESPPPHHHHDDGDHHHHRPDSPVSVFANLCGTGLPWRQVLSLALSNLKLKILSRRACCGNDGQPGC